MILPYELVINILQFINIEEINCNILSSIGIENYRIMEKIEEMNINTDAIIQVYNKFLYKYSNDLYIIPKLIHSILNDYYEKYVEYNSRFFLILRNINDNIHLQYIISKIKYIFNDTRPGKYKDKNITKYCIDIDKSCNKNIILKYLEYRTYFSHIYTSKYSLNCFFDYSIDLKLDNIYCNLFYPNYSTHNSIINNLYISKKDIYEYQFGKLISLHIDPLKLLLTNIYKVNYISIQDKRLFYLINDIFLPYISIFFICDNYLKFILTYRDNIRLRYQLSKIIPFLSQDYFIRSISDHSFKLYYPITSSFPIHYKTFYFLHKVYFMSDI